MTLVNTMNNIDIWKKHFINMINGKNKKQKNVYIVQSGEGDKTEKNQAIKLVTPTEQAVERARADLKRSVEEKEEMGPTSTIKRRKRKKVHIRPKKSKRDRKKIKRVIKKKKRKRTSKDTFGVY